MSRRYTIEDLTINVCTVDRHHQLLACLDSLTETTPPGAPLTVVFNGSPAEMIDAARERIDAWPGPTHLEIVEDTLPVTDSHNLALSLVKTPLVNFMGDDDIVLGERLPLILDAFNDLDPEPLVVTTFARRIAGDTYRPRIGSGKELGPTTIEGWAQWRDDGRMFEMLWPGAVLNTEALRSIGGFEADFDRTFDNRIFTRLSVLGPVLSLPDHNFGYRIHEGSLSTSNFILQSQQVRHVQACRTAELEGRPPPTRAEFVRSEEEAPLHERLRTRLRAQSRMHFRRGSAFLFGDGRKAEGLGHLAAAAAIWPPAFIEKVLDQRQPLESFKR